MSATIYKFPEVIVMRFSCPSDADRALHRLTRSSVKGVRLNRIAGVWLMTVVYFDAMELAVQNAKLEYGQ